MRGPSLSASSGVLVLVGGLAGCTALLEQPTAFESGPDGPGAPAGSGNGAGGLQTGGGGSGGSGGQIEPETCEAEPGFVPLHRLNKREFEAAVLQVFGVAGDYAASLPSDNKVSRYDNNAAAQQITGALVEGYLTASRRIVDDLRSDPAARNRFFSCEDAQDEACAGQKLEQVATLAFRRTVSPDEVEALLAPYRQVRSLELDFEQAMAASLQAVIVSPDFLFRAWGAESQLSPQATSGVPLSGTEYVTRLAAFIWGSVPDQTLLDQARAGWFDDRHLADTQARIRETVQTMLQDPRAGSMVDTFFGTFLHLNMMNESDRRPDPRRFPEWSEALENDMITETRTFLQNLIANDESPFDLLTADYTYANRRLAQVVYGLEGEGMDDGTFQRVQLPPERRGILTQPTVLTMTSNPDRTSIVNRGLWVMDNLMCLPTPSDAPPDAPTETPEIEGASIRERTEAHRSDPSCAVCHDTMDPLGFGMERETDDDGFPVDARGELPDGRTFAGAIELVDVIAESGEFERCLARNMLEYAVGRRFGFGADACTFAQIASELDADSPFSEWVFQIVTRTPFSMQQLPEEAP